MKLKLTADNIYEQLTKLAGEYADASVDAKRLEKYEKILFSELVLRSTANSMVAKEHEARSSKEFKDHVDGLLEAERAAIKARAAYSDAHDWLDWRRTEAATERMYMKGVTP